MPHLPAQFAPKYDHRFANKIEIRFAEETVSEQEIGIAPYRFLKQANGLEQTFLATEIDVCLIVENSGAHIKIVRDEIARRRLRDRGLFTR